MITGRRTRLSDKILVAAEALAHLERVVATVKGRGRGDAKFAAALGVLDTLSSKEGIPLAIVSV